MKKKSVKEFIFERPEEWVHIRKIARRLQTSPNTVRKVISNLEKEKIVERRKSGNLIQVRANFDSEDYKIEKKIHNLYSVYRSGIVNFLYDYYQSPIVLFGSYSRGEDTSVSDIDIGILTSEKSRPKMDVFEKKLGRKINLSLFTRKEVSEEFFKNIINGVVLKGVLR